VNPARHKLWIAFWTGVLLIVAVLGWASARVYILEERNATARAENQRQEVIRLALWRMDSRLAPMIALEAARPIQDYKVLIGETQPELDEGLADSASRIEPENQDVVRKGVNSGSYNLGFFEIDESGLAKGTLDRAIEVAQNTKEEGYSTALDDTEKDLETRTNTAVPSSESNPAASDDERESESKSEADYQARQQIADLAQYKRAARNVEELPSTPERVETDSSDHFNNAMSADQSDSIGYSPSNIDLRLEEQSPSVSIGAIEPRWVVGDDGVSELVLTRTISQDGRSIVQGVLLDWPSLSRDLINAIEDLLPTSTLRPIRVEQPQGKSATSSYRLATIPVSFHPGGAIAVEGDSITPALFAMMVTWIAVIGAMIAVGIVLRTVLTLSARRGRFVGAVTHELRTPLTTFRLYSQMLADGMVTDEAVGKDYLNTLKRESDRLTGIVENVLEYARISRQKGVKDKPKGEQTLSVGEMMARIVPPMSRLGEQFGMDLIVSDSTSDDAERTMTLDPHAVERIVMNLMDNACKYAGGDGDSDEERDLRVHLDASVAADSLLLVVADHGPGVPARDRRKIFGEFVRGSSGTMRDRSGLGLGLALSRGLAIEMGGDLSLVRKRGHGAEFELRIPLN
jgi:signal transduction histidine kinase